MDSSRTLCIILTDSVCAQITAGDELADVIVFIDQNQESLTKTATTKAEYISESLDLSCLCLPLSVEISRRAPTLQILFSLCSA